MRFKSSTVWLVYIVLCIFLRWIIEYQLFDSMPNWPIVRGNNKLHHARINVCKLIAMHWICWKVTGAHVSRCIVLQFVAKWDQNIAMNIVYAWRICIHNKIAPMSIRFLECNCSAMGKDSNTELAIGLIRLNHFDQWRCYTSAYAWIQ